METQVGVVKQISGLVVAVDQNGVSRVLQAGDTLYLGEVIKTSSASSKAVVAMDNGKDVTILGDESLRLDENVISEQNLNTIADVTDLQKALLNGEDLTSLEETAAGGNAAAGGGDGVSLGAASFEHGGHYSNISASTSAINPLNTASLIGGNEGVRGGVDDDTANSSGTGVDISTPSANNDVTRAHNPSINPIDNDDTKVTGKVDNPEKNTTVTVTFPDGSTATTTVDNNGKWEVPTPNNTPLKPGETVTATAQDNGGKSQPVNSNEVGDVTRAHNPSINPIDNDDTKVTGKVDNPEKNTTVTVTFPDGSTATTTVDNNGKWEVPTPNNTPLNPGETVTATAQDNGGKSQPVNSNEVGDVINPTVGNVKADQIDTDTKADGRPNKVVVTADSDEPNAPVVVTIGGKTFNTTTGADGKVNLTITDKDVIDRVQKGDEVKVEVTDKAGNKGEGAGNVGGLGFEGDNTAPTAPTVEFVDDTEKPTGVLNKKEIGNDGKTEAKISFNPSEVSAGDKVDYTVNGEKQPPHTLTEAEVKQGFIKVDVPVKAGATSASITEVVITDQAGNASEPGSRTIVIDTEIATISAKFVEDRNGNHILTLKENKTDSNVKATKLKLKVSGDLEEGDKITLHLDDPTKGSGDIVLKKVGNKMVVESASESLKGMAPIGAAAPIKTSSDGSKTIDINGIGMKNGNWTVAKAYITDEAGNKSNEATDYFRYKTDTANINVTAIYGDNNVVGVLPGQSGSTKLQASDFQHDKIDGNPYRDFNINVNVITRNPTVTLYDGDDHVAITKYNGGYGWLNDRSTLNLGNGDNRLDVDANIDKATVTAGSGNDIVDIGKNDINGYLVNSTVELGGGNDILKTKTNIDLSTVKMGDGDDTVDVGNYIHNSTINLGNGNDTLIVRGKGMLVNNNIDGEDGYDKLVLTNAGNKVDLSIIDKQVNNFEEIDISNANKNTTVNVTLKDVMGITDSDNVLAITGDSGDKVSLTGGRSAGWREAASGDHARDGYKTYTNTDDDGNTVFVQIKNEVDVPL